MPGEEGRGGGSRRDGRDEVKEEHSLGSLSPSLRRLVSLGDQQVTPDYYSDNWLFFFAESNNSMTEINMII
jgi:hypothetical protein